MEPNPNQIPTPSPDLSRNPSQSRNLAPLLIILFVLLIAVGGYSARKEGWLSGLGFGGEPQLGGEVPAGSVVQGFPLGFVNLIEDAEVTESGRYEGGGGRDALRAVFSTKAPVPELFAAYVNYFTEQGYALTKMGSQADGTFVAAKNDAGEEVEVSLSVAGSSRSEVKIDVFRP